MEIKRCLNGVVRLRRSDRRGHSDLKTAVDSIDEAISI